MILNLLMIRLQKISGIIGSLNLTVENYPELKANEAYKRLSEILVIIEDEIALSRKYYNGTIRDYQRFTQMFPNNLFAKLLKSPEFLMFEISENEKENIKI